MRALYELMGRRLPLPRPTSPGEERGERPDGYFCRLSNAQAALGVRQLRALDQNLTHRRMVAETYERALAGQGVSISRAPPHIRPAYVRYPMWAPDRAEVVRAINRYALPGLWFSSVLEDGSSPAAGGYQPGSCPCAEAAAQHLINLPTHPGVTVADAQQIAATLAPALRARASADAPHTQDGADARCWEHAQG